MELLLNVIWVALAASAFLIFLHARRDHCDRSCWGRSLLALACVWLLLFPIISASDDLHPSAVLLEDTIKRVQPGSPLPSSVPHAAIPMAMLLLCIGSLQSLTLWQRRRPVTLAVRILAGCRLRHDGRAPPLALA